MDAAARRGAKAAYRRSLRDADWRSLGLDRRQLADLHAYLEGHGVDECSDTFALTRARAAAAGLAWADVERGLRSQAAYCDCEVLTVDPEAAT